MFNPLLRATSDDDVEDRLVDFLVKRISYLTERLREEIREVLLMKEHPMADNFMRGWTINVVQLKTKAVTGDSRALAAARKRARADDDRARTFATKGASNGGGAKKRK